ncbi:hypothetical protein O3P69_009276 [Scylla paramamosain]|uniref:PiggyBac transposable element-derived protein domain-containing protein n=1 Tax=Scylla paramamosain TaxID=85552 RepID=A0AAW0TD27_SCYPA
MKVDQPNAIKVYNTNMGSVDLLNNMALRYFITTRNRKWYWALHNWFLSVFCTVRCSVGLHPDYFEAYHQ